MKYHNTKTTGSCYDSKTVYYNEILTLNARKISANKNVIAALKTG